MTKPTSNQSPVIHDTRARAAQTAKEYLDNAVDFTVELVRLSTPSGSDNCAKAIELVQEKFKSLGIKTEILYSRQDHKRSSPTVIGWLGHPSQEPDLLLNSHVDTVKAGSGWTVEPFGGALIDGRLYGRGTFTKVDASVFIYALAAAAKYWKPGCGASVAVAISSDEGAGGYLGVKSLLEEANIRPKRAITNGVTNQITIAHSGCVQARIIIKGLAIHQSIVPRERETLRAATELASEFVKANDRHFESKSGMPGIPHPTMNVTKLSGGDCFGAAPSSAEMWVDRRILPHETLGGATAEVAKIIDSFSETVGNGINITYEFAGQAEPLRPFKEQAEWASKVQHETKAVLGRAAPLGGLPVFTDARWFGHHKIPVVMYGAGRADLIDAGANGADENVPVSDIETAVQVVARVIAREVDAG